MNENVYLPIWYLYNYECFERITPLEWLLTENENGDGGDDGDDGDFSNDYLTFEALEDGTISFNIWSNMGTDYITSISYSIDNGTTWTTINNTDNKVENIQITVNVNQGDTILWKGNVTQLGFWDDDKFDSVGSFFSSTCEFNAYGNIMSMLYGDNFVGQNTINENYAFTNLFYDYDEELECNIIDASNLILPATTLAERCYAGMFNSCTSLATAPELPATTLARYCYYSMFNGCTSLTSAPELPAITLAYGCYSNMFNSCTSLTKAPELPATTLAESCYSYMFNGCTSLTTAHELPATTLATYCYQDMFRSCTSLIVAPELPVTTLAYGCYNGMFSSCTSLTTAPKLPATTLATYCYQSMFYGCTSLTTAPELPATTLTMNCYSNMFYNCTSLTTAPELPATTLVGSCYSQMFYGCTSLNYIKCLATKISMSDCTYHWTQNVASSGTFVKADSMSSWTTGTNGIPSGWTVQDA